MSYLEKTFTYERHEKFDEFLTTFGVDKAHVDAVNSQTSTEKLEKNGDTYTFTLFNRVVNFKSGVEFDEDLNGLDKAFIAAVNSNKATQVLEKNGDTYTLTLFNKTLTCKSGEEFDEVVGNGQARTTFVVDGDTITQTQKFPDGRTVTFKRQYSGDKLVVEVTSSVWDGVAYRYYSA